MATNNSVNTSLASQTGTGAFVGSTSPTLVTPILGAAAATSINFGGDTLSNYVSKGTFTPAFTFATPGDSSFVYTSQIGIYTRIGSVVFFEIVLSGTPTFTTASGNIVITGLPITVTNTPSAVNATAAINLAAGFTWPAARTSPVFTILNNTTTALIQGQGTAVATASFGTANVTTTVAIVFATNGFYFV